MKRLVPLIAAAALLLTLCACGGDPSPTAAPSPQTTASADPVSPGRPGPTASVDPVPPTVTAEPLPSPTPTQPPQKEPEPDRPLISDIAVYYGGNSSTVPSILVRGMLSEAAGLGFSLYCDAETYEWKDDGNSFRFVRRTDEDAAPDSLTFMELLFIDGATVSRLAPNFMDLYLDCDEVESSPERTIGVSELRCDTIVGYNSEQYVTAFLYGRSGGVAAFVISCSTADNDYHRPRFTAMLDTVALFDTEE